MDQTTVERIQTTAPAPASAETPQATSRAEACLTAQDALRGKQAAASTIRSQIENILVDRTNIAQRLRQGGAASGADLDGLQNRLKALDEQLVKLYTSSAEAEAAVVAATAVPCAVPPPPPPRPRTGPPEEAFVLGGMFIFFVLFPVAIAYSRRVWRRGAKVVMGITGELGERLNRLEESVDAVAIEVERIGEGQRFVTNLFIESGGPQMLGTGAVDAVNVRQREGVELERRG